MTARVVAVCTGQAREHTLAGRPTTTAIDKRPVDGPVRATVRGLDGDTQADQRHHGGVDQALYAYGQSDADHWAAALRREVPAGSLGENLRIGGLEVSDALIGQRWAIGREVVVQVTAPRIPCRVFAGFWDVDDLVSRFISAGRPGAYLRVLEAGEVAAGDAVRVLDRPDHDVSVAEAMRIHTSGRGEVSRLLGLDGLAARFRAWAEEAAGAAAR